MAVETKDVKHYKTFHLSLMKYTDRSKDHKSILVSVVPEAVFDDKDLLDTYIKDAGLIVTDDINVPSVMPVGEFCYIREEWSVQKPAQQMFNVTLNPKFVLPEPPKQETESTDTETEHAGE